METSHKKKHIVILGGGFGGIYTLLRLHRIYHHDPSLSITVINRDNYFLFTPLLHEVATGSVASDNIIYNIRSLMHCCTPEFLQAEVGNVDLAGRLVHTDRGDISYDVLVLALGASTNFFGLDEESQRRAVTLKTLGDARIIKNKVIDCFEEGRPANIVVVGGGPTGVELAAELVELTEDLSALFPQRPRTDTTIHLVQADARLLPAFNADLGERAAEVLKKKGVQVMLGEAVARIGETTAELKSGGALPCSLAIWTAGVRANEVPAAPAPLPTDRSGRIIVNEYLSVPDHPEIFVVGDAAGVPGMPMTAQGATASAAAAADNIFYFLSGRPLQPFRYRHKGDLFSLGQWMAGAELYKVRFFGHFAWWLWRTIYLSKVIGARNKMKVALDWTINIFMPRDLNRY